MITFAFLSHHSKNLIRKNIEKIASYNLGVSFLVIENSLDRNFKTELENQYDNIKVFIPNENLGFSKGMNKAVELSKTNFVFLNPADVIIPLECAKGIIECINAFNDFTLLAPTYNDETVYKNYEENIFSKKNEKKHTRTINNKFHLQEIDWIDGTFVVNKNKIMNHKIMDENFFIYFETMDMCLNFKKNNNKMYVIKNLKFDHLGAQSHDKKYNFEANLSRNWHYNWSKFYYIKKNIGYFYALKKSLSLLIKFLFKFLTNILKFDIQSAKLNYAEISGLLSAVFCRKSTYRPFIK